MVLSEVEEILMRRTVVKFLRPQLLGRLKANIENNLKNKLESPPKSHTPHAIDEGRLATTTYESNPTVNELEEITKYSARKRRRVQYDDGLKDGCQMRREEQCTKDAARGRSKTKTKNYSSLTELMRDVEELSNYIETGNERHALLLLDAIVI